MDDNTSSLIQRKQSRNESRKIIRKQPRNSSSSSSRKRAIKVVYISNPMRVSATASEFRDLVQSLTGQHAADLPDPAPTSVAADHQPAAVPPADDDDAAALLDVDLFTWESLLMMAAAPTGQLCS